MSKIIPDEKFYLDVVFTLCTIFIISMIFIAGIAIGSIEYFKILMYITGGLIACFILGMLILSAIDENNELYDWVWNKAPSTYFSILAVVLFPIVAFAYIYRKRKIK